MPTGITFELIQRDYLREFGEFLVEKIKIAHGSYTGHIIATADFLSRNNLFEGKDDLGHKAAGYSVIARQEGVFLKETLATAAAITALAQV